VTQGPLCKTVALSESRLPRAQAKRRGVGRNGPNGSAYPDVATLASRAEPAPGPGPRPAPGPAAHEGGEARRRSTYPQ
jgi:hypothetical protein